MEYLTADDIFDYLKSGKSIDVKQYYDEDTGLDTYIYIDGCEQWTEFVSIFDLEDDPRMSIEEREEDPRPYGSTTIYTITLRA